MFQKHDLPSEIEEYSLKDGQTILDVLIDSGLVTSRAEGRRMVDQKGVRLDGAVIDDGQKAFPHRGVLQVGKRRFIRVV
jgi:tyrosyl-tRNA synthetase